MTTTIWREPYNVVGQTHYGSYLIEVNEEVKKFIEENIGKYICTHCGQLRDNETHKKINDYLDSLPGDYEYGPSYICCYESYIICGTHQ